MLREYIAVDLEMTGLKPRRDRILEIGALHMKDGEILDEYQTLVNPETTISEEIEKLTGISQVLAESGKSVPEAVGEFLAFQKGLPLVGHNVIFDFSFLKQNAANCKLKLEAKAVDTLKLSRKLLQEPEKKTLESICVYFQIWDKQEHRALGDARATAQLFELLQRRFYTEYPELFEPKELQYKVKKQRQVMPVQ